MKQATLLEIAARLGSTKFPVKVLFQGGDTIAIESADRDMVEHLLECDALSATIQRNGKLKWWQLTKPLGSLGLSLKRDRLPVAEANNTTVKQNLGDGRLLYKFNSRVVEGYSPANRLAFV